ncbi:MAG: MTH1187 family thiamine-binding protein [Candidatus Methylarchaceae archaeon HK02M1]|nr:MTH1187 family thiamine-binding protein [Candidatus Methylarchaceae archaeon HK01M]MCP8312488.1 MTH1187 family thiamine-binding protein [Candidatus Methylarchaceae archaeon HK02M1]
MGSSKIVIIADFSIIPLGLGTTSVGKQIAEAVNAMKKVEGMRYEVTPMGTVLEAERLETILEAVKVAHEVLFKMGVKRVESNLRIDDRRDKPRTMEEKVKGIKEYMKK